MMILLSMLKLSAAAGYTQQQYMIFINPFDSCCYRKEMGSWQARIKAIRNGNPRAKILATFHTTEIWAEDINVQNSWLPPQVPGAQHRCG